MKDQKSINQIIEKLKRTNTDEVLLTINHIRNSGEPKILKILIELLNGTNDEQIFSAIVNLLNDLKIQSATSEIITAIQDDNFRKIRKNLLTSCWQSGLDYSGYLSLFVEIFIMNEFDIAFEAMTIIENIEESYTDDIINPLIAKLELNRTTQTGTKKELFPGLIDILKNKIG